MSTILHLLRGKMSSPVNHLGADVLIYHFSQGGRCPRGEMSGSRSMSVIDRGCTTFRRNPFRRIDNSSNTTIGLKKGSGTTLHLKKIKDFRRIVAPVLFFVISDFSSNI